jgi:UrcA family protein
MTVKFFDLDMTRASDASILYRRIRQAADMVCEPLSRGPALPSRPFDTCVGNAIDGAVAKVNAPALNAVYAAKTGKPTPGARVAIARN